MIIFDKHIEMAKSLSDEYRLKYFDLIVKYVYENKDISQEEIAEMPELMRALWIGTKYDIDSYRESAENGRKGARAKKEKASSTQEGDSYPPSTPPQPPFDTPPTKDKDKDKYKDKDNTNTMSYIAREEQNSQTLSSSSIPQNIFPILNPRESPFVANPPQVEAVFNYGQTNIDSAFTWEQAQAFIDYYDGVGWVSGRNHQPIRKWQTFLKPWIERGKKFSQEQKQQEQKHQEGMVMSDAEFDRYLEQKLAQYEEPPRFNADGTYADASRAS